VKGKGHEREVDVCTCMEDGDDGMQSEVKWQCRFAVNNSDNRNKGESEQKGSINKYMVKEETKNKPNHSSLSSLSSSKTGPMLFPLHLNLLS